MTTTSAMVARKAGETGAFIAKESLPDEQIIALWLHGRSLHTQRAYRADIGRLLIFTGSDLRGLTLGDLQAFADSLGELAPATRARTLSAVKSLLGFGHRLGYLIFDVGGALRLPNLRNGLAARIIPEDAVHRILAMESDTRNHAMLRLLYAAGLRVSELCGLVWRDVQPRGKAGQVTVFGKGGLTRTVLLTEATYGELMTLPGAINGDQDAPVFRSGKGGPLQPRQVGRIVHAAAKRAGIPAPVSPHWLRHAHASHALDRGAPIHLVQATLGHASVATTGKYLHARPDASSATYLAV